MKKKRIQGSGSESLRKISRTGGYTYYVTIPKSVLDELGWRERQLVKVSKAGKKIVISDG